MNIYEELLNDAEQENVSVYENYDFKGTRFKGLYCDNTIALSSDLKTSVEKRCIMEEELGHHCTTVGDITNQSKVDNRKQEHRARLWAYRHAIDLSDFISAYKNGCRNRYEIAEHLEVTETFLDETIEAYKCQYGMFATVDRYIIYFEPLGVLEINF